MTDEMIQEKAEKFADALSDGLYFKNGQLRKCRKHGFIQGAQLAKQQMIEEACRWLERNSGFYSYRELDEYDMQYYARIDKKKMIEDFRKAMEE